MTHPDGRTEAEQAAQVGKSVRTLEDAGGSGWLDPDNRGCRWGVSGTIIDYSNSHGLCFRVRHFLGGDTAWYDPEELELL
jgi:hypothetical protein